MYSIGKPAARMTDLTAHGGTIVTGDSTVIIGDFPAARVGDSQVCPVTDSQPHVGGTITSGSDSVMIGDLYAARKDDQCPCTCGKSGQGIPQKLPSKMEPSWKEKKEGLGKAEKIEQVGEKYKFEQIRKKSKAPSAKELAENGGEWFDYENDKMTIVRDEDGDIVYVEDTSESSRVKTTSSESSFDFGLDYLGNPLEAKVTHSSLQDYRTGKEHDYKDFDPLDSTQEETEIGANKDVVNIKIGSKGGNNPLIDMELTARKAYSESKKFKLIGTDGRRYGLDIGGAVGVGAGGVGAKAKFDLGTIIPPFLYLRKLGYNVEALVDISSDAALAGGARIRAVYDTEEKRTHLGFFAKFIAGAWVDISIGKMKPEGIPNVIATGCLTVLIG